MFPESVVSPDVALCTRNWEATSANPDLWTISSHCRDSWKYLPSSQAPFGPELVDVLMGFSNYIFIFPSCLLEENTLSNFKEPSGKSVE